MKLASQFIKELQGLIKEHGDLPIVSIGSDGENGRDTEEAIVDFRGAYHNNPCWFSNKEGDIEYCDCFEVY